MKRGLAKLILILLILNSCSEWFVGADVEDTPQNNFDTLWNDFDHFYPAFGYKKVDWDSLYSVYSPQVDKYTNDDELLDVFSAMLDNLHDGHADLPGRYSYQGQWRTAPKDFSLEVVKTKYLNNSFSTVGRTIYYGKLEPEIGYIYIRTFSGNVDVSVFKGIDKIIRSFGAIPSVIIDVRDNGGGSSNNADIIIARFADKKRLTSWWQYRTGKNHSDLSVPIAAYLKPEGILFSGKVAVLTNVRCFSATEHFVTSISVFPNVILIGDSTGGGTNGPFYRELPNGWIFRVPRSVTFTADMEVIEDVGIIPDILVLNKEEEIANGRDAILDAAIEYLGR